LNEILNLQKTVYEKLIDKSKLACLSEEEFHHILSGHGLMIGVYVDDVLIATRALLDPGNDPDHLGLAIGLEKSELDKVIYQEISFVHQDYQGNGLQKIMASLIMQELSKTSHSYKYICATVAPDNIPSLKDKFAQNMEIKALVTIYDEKQRYVFAKKLIDVENKQNMTHETNIKFTNLSEIKKHLHLNWNGIELFQRNNEYYIKFIKY